MGNLIKISFYLPRRNGENYENPQSQWSMSLPRLKLCTCRMQISSVFVYWHKLHDINVYLAPYGNAYCVKGLWYETCAYYVCKKYVNGNCRTMLMRSEVVVIVECAALTEWEHQKADFCVHTTMRRHSGSFVTHTKYKRGGKNSTCENFKIRFKLWNNGSL
jgi:hypothetical protein